MNDNTDRTFLLVATVVLVLMLKSELTDKPSAAPVGELVVEGRNLYVCCSDLMLRLVEVQPAGKRRMAAADFINGWRK